MRIMPETPSISIVKTCYCATCYKIMLSNQGQLFHDGLYYTRNIV